MHLHNQDDTAAEIKSAAISRIHNKLIEYSTRNGIEWDILCERELCAIEGNCSAIDPDIDLQVADKIQKQLDAGNDWAW